MNIIASVDENWGIGLKGRLLVRIPADMKTFQQMTAGAVLVMGRRTLESFSNAQPLAGRVNIVLTRNPNWKVRNAILVHSVEETLERLDDYRDREVFVIGGESIFRQFLPFCDAAHITKIHQVFETDAFFPNLDLDPDWSVTNSSEEQTYFDLEYHFLKYERRKS